jgi:hypothetical protein
VVWEDKRTQTYSPQSSSGGNTIVILVTMVINAAIAKAAPNYIPLGKQINNIAFSYPGPGFSYDPYINEKETNSKIVDEKKSD